MKKKQTTKVSMQDYPACKKLTKQFSCFSVHLSPVTNKSGLIAQSVARLIPVPGVVSSITAQPHTLVEIYCEIFSTNILLLPLIYEGLLSVTSVSILLKIIEGPILSIIKVMHFVWNVFRKPILRSSLNFFDNFDALLLSEIAERKWKKMLLTRIFLSFQNLT